MSTASIRRLRERLVYSDPENPWVRLYFDDVAMPDGKRGRYNRIVEGREHAGPGVVVAHLALDKITFVETYRYPIDRCLLELPRGFGEPGADAIVSARRELLEETGLTADSYEILGSIYPNSGVLATEVAVVRALGSRTSEARPLLEEGISKVVFLSMDEINTRIKQGQIADAITLGALLLLRN